VDLVERMTTFVRIVETGSLAAAARQLRISSAAVSRQLAAIENEMGAALVLRSTRRLSVTDVGNQYYARCLRILREIDEAWSLGRSQTDLKGLLTVSAPVTFGLARIAPHVSSLLTKHPGLCLDLRLEDRIVDLVGEGIDLAIRAGIQPPVSDSLVAHALLTYERVAVASPAYLERMGEPRTPDALASHVALLSSSGEGRSRTWRFQRKGRGAHVQIAASFRSNALYALREAAVRGTGIALLPEWLVTQEVARGDLRLVLQEWRAPPTSVVAIHRAEQRGAPRIRAFIEHLREALG
jgi:DNA-binding transcriptional LysR family regulator